jgi:hypothetical protein
MMAVLWDLGRLAWVTIVLIAVVWLPAAVSKRSLRPSIAIVLRRMIEIAVLGVAAVTLLGPAHLLNPLTLLVTCGSWPLLCWFARHRRSVAADGREALQRLVLTTASTVERSGTGYVTMRLREAAAALSSQLGNVANAATKPSAMLISVAALVALFPQLIAALANTRLPNSNAYGDLLSAQQLLAGEVPWGTPHLVGALTAAISVVSSIAPVHLIRLLVPIGSAVIFLALIGGIRALTMSTGPSVIAAIGAALLWPRSPELLSSQMLLAIGWALVAGGIAHLATQHFEFRRPPLRMAFAAAAAVLGIALAAPKAASANYVEYDAAARAALDISTRFPKYRWMIVAPIEEWALTYGRGWHLNLHEFVEDVGPRVSDAYQLPYKIDDVFVFVETRPFATFENEPLDVPFKTLVDPVYRHYRSSAGRASLEFAAYKLCERLRATDPRSSVYFEDGRLKIYRFRLR